MINLLIPMAGRGQRFADAGYKKPKPFIDVCGKPLIHRVIENVDPISMFRLILVMQDNQKDEWCSRGLLSRPSFYFLNGVTDGAARTVLLAKEYFDNDDELIIANSDQIIGDKDWCDYGRNVFIKNDSDCGVWCFLNDNPKWSYVKVENGLITRVEEKKPISQIATCGVYWFRHGKDFVRAAESMIKKDIRTNNEFYIAPAINELIGEGKKVMPYMINQMYGFGTPEDMNASLAIYR